MRSYQTILFEIVELIIIFINLMEKQQKQCCKSEEPSFESHSIA